ncbi:MAG: acyltransferase [Desulfobacteraceae bacterium]|nr:acyltransferase [Desulfobacteraceae bacterium]
MDKQKLDEKNFIRHKIFNDNRSALVKYADLVIGKFSFFRLIKYELIMTFFSPLPGAAGIFLRRLAFPFLFKRIGRKVIWGRNVVIRHPEKIFLGDRVVVDDYCVIDGRGAGDQGVVIGDDVFIGRNVSIQSKVGGISIGPETSIGAGSSIVSQGGIIIGDMVNIAGGCSISGGAYDVTRGQKSEREHEKYTKGPIQIGRKCRLGQQVMVLDGVQIGEGSILGAKALVNGSLPEYCVAAGIPAKVIRLREKGC